MGKLEAIKRNSLFLKNIYIKLPTAPVRYRDWAPEEQDCMCMYKIGLAM